MQPDSNAGFHHPLIRAARALQLKKHRLERRCFLIEGPTAVEAALAAERLEIEHVFVSPGHARSDEVAAQAAAAGRRVIHVDDRTMRSIAPTATPQGVIAVAAFFHRDVDLLSGALDAAPKPCVVAVLHHIADPGNAGTLIRSAEALGAAAVCCGSGSVDPYNDKVIRASMGSIFHLPLFLYDGWERLAAAVRAAQLSLVAAEAGAPDVRLVTIPIRAALVVGHERLGLADIPAHDIQLRIGIPQHRRAQSLNAAVAGSIALYEIARASGCLPEGPVRTNDT